MKHRSSLPKTHEAKRSLQKAASYPSARISAIEADGRKYVWSTRMEKVELIRGGLPYGSLEVISQRLDKPVKAILAMVGMPQTTYNKKKSEHSLLDSRDSELVMMITELIDYGLYVFNAEEEKFQRWLRKPNLSLGGNTPESLMDTVTGIDEVTYCLARIDTGNFA